MQINAGGSKENVGRGDRSFKRDAMARVSLGAMFSFS